jgi:uncharacterized protein (TIGR03435 family)
MKKLALSFVLCVLGAQTLPPPPAYKFEVAVIRPSRNDSPDVWLIPEAHGWRGQNVVVWDLIKVAYYVRDQQLAGGPPWIKTDRYDITAKAEKMEAEPPTPKSPLRAFMSYEAQNNQRLQGLLKDRFGLVLRIEMRDGPFYSLKVAKTGSKMEAFGDRDGDPFARLGEGHLAMIGDMKGLVSMLMDVLERPVIDETGLSGDYTSNWNGRRIQPDRSIRRRDPIRRASEKLAFRFSKR